MRIYIFTARLSPVCLQGPRPEKPVREANEALAEQEQQHRAPNTPEGQKLEEVGANPEILEQAQELKDEIDGLLDEIDAPLDDANIGRFIEMLKGLQASTQFVLITHNRKTMEIADRLYGITMEEPGVSRLISMELR